MSIEEEKEVIAKLLDNLETAIVLLWAQRATLSTLAPEEKWGPMVLRAEGAVAEHIREELSQLRETILASSSEVPLPHDLDRIVRNLIESAKDIDLPD